MKITTIRYEKLANLGNYENQKLGVEVTLDDGENPAEAVRRAMAFVNGQLMPACSNYEIGLSLRIVANPDDYSPDELHSAQELLAKVAEADNVPF